MAGFDLGSCASKISASPVDIYEISHPDGKLLATLYVSPSHKRVTEIAEEMNISKGQVSKMAKRGITTGWLRNDGHDYVLTGQA